MNNKGFAITTILYGLLILFCFLLVSLLGILATYHRNMEKLIDASNGTRTMITKRMFYAYDCDYNYAGDSTYIVEKTSEWAGYCIDSDMFTNDKNYRLTYSLKKNNGSLINIGGDALAAKNITFYLDNQLQDSYSGTQTNITDDTNTHNVVVEFRYDDTNVSNRDICIQPNRGLSTGVSVNIFNLSLTELS